MLLTKKKTLFIILIAICAMPIAAIGASMAMRGGRHAAYAATGVPLTGDNTTLSNGTYYLESDVTIEQTIRVSYGNSVILDLNGHVLEFVGENGYAIEVGGSLLLTDGNKNAHHENIDIDGGVITGGKSGGVYVEGGSFTMDGGTITGNSATENGGGVYVTSGSFTMNGGTITENSAEDNGGGVYVSSGYGKFEMSDGTISGNTAKLGGGVYSLGGDIDMDGGAITGNSAEESGGGVNAVGGCTFEMSDGSISGNIAKRGGGGVFVGDGVTFALSGNAEISSNTAEAGGGVQSAGTVEMSDNATVFGNAAKFGGGVYSSVEFTMNGGSISGNTASADDYSDARGGGVFNYGIFTAIGGAIEGNRVNAVGGNAAYGGGMYSTGTLNVAGAVRIFGNKNGMGAGATDDNVFLPVEYTISKKITVTGALKDGGSAAEIGVTFGGNYVEAFTAGYSEHNKDGNDATIPPSAYFIADNGKCVHSSSGEASLGEHTFGEWQAAVAPTCSATGAKAHKDCTLCRKHFDSAGAPMPDISLAIDATAHSWDGGTVTVAPTCTQIGVRTFVCAHSSQHKRTEQIPALGHSLTHVVRADATLTANGNIEYWTCSVCNGKFSDADGTNAVDSVIIPKLTTELVKPDADGDARVTVSSPAGFSHDIELVVAEIDKTGYAAYESVAQAANGEISLIYDVSLRSGGATVNHDGTLTVKLRIPVNLRGKSFKLFHMHGGEATEIAYTVDGNYVVTNVDGLSEFIFVGEKTAAREPDGFDPLWLVLIIVVCLIIAGEVGYMVYKLVRKTKAEEGK